MKRYALIRGGKVENVIVADESFRADAGWKSIESDTAAIGDLWDGERFSRPTSAELIKGTITSICESMIRQAYGPYGEAITREWSKMSVIAASGSMSDEDKEEAAMLASIAQWEKDMRKTRDKLLATSDVPAAMKPETWPKQPAGLSAFLTRF